jgi:exopolyphosphatase/guanosine-5'-triphosphate,3'-diphosphate pyrophosphatase
MRIAIIDLGTNTFNLLIADINGRDNFKSIFSTKIAVKLGEGGMGKKQISAPAFARGIKALRAHKDLIRKFGAVRTIAFATSAIRSSVNGIKFIAAAKKEAGVDVTVISGEKEAELIYKGVRLALDIGDTPSLILDIGGGSNEFIIATKERVLWKKSFDIGVARLLERFAPSDPVTTEDIKRLEDHLEDALGPLFEAVKQYPVKELIGSSGSFDTFAEMIAYRYADISAYRGKTEFRFDMDQFREVHAHLLRSTREERLRTPGIIELRADMIVVGSITVNYILQRLAIPGMRMSTYALKQGVLAEVVSGF